MSGELDTPTPRDDGDGRSDLNRGRRVAFLEGPRQRAGGASGGLTRKEHERFAQLPSASKRPQGQHVSRLHDRSVVVAPRVNDGLGRAHTSRRAKLRAGRKLRAGAN